MAKKKKKRGISEPFYTAKYLRRSRDLYRKYLESKPWTRQLHKEFLQLKPGIKVVDVGCGTGDFTRYIASLVGDRCKVIGVDSRGASLRTALSETRRAGMLDRISYRKGDAYSLPVEDNCADLACCRALLMHLKEPVKAVKQMARVAKPGGLVAAFETGGMFSFYDPTDEEFTRLAREINPAYFEGVRRLEGKDYEIGERLPSIFHDAGLSEIKAEIQGEAWMTCDPRLDIDYVKAEVKLGLEMFRQTKNDFKRALSAAGIKPAKTRKFIALQEKRFRKLLAPNSNLRDNTSFYGEARLLIAGRKKAS